MKILLRQPIHGMTPDQNGQMTIFLECTVDLPGIPSPGLEIRGLRISDTAVKVRLSELDIRSSECCCTLEAVGSSYTEAHEARRDFGPNWQERQA
jgi:hypothetical protein